MFGLAPVRGSFAVRAGTVDLTEPLTASRISVDIEVASFSTGNAQRDASVRSRRFLGAGQYPVISFSSTGLNGRVLTGTVTVRDVTRPVDLLVELIDVSPRAFTARATVRIDRTEFGVTAQRGLAGRYLDLSVEARCVRN
jgi:polyisoprenoid-binding protein YceI